MKDLNLGQSVTHFRLLSPNILCHLQVPEGKEDDGALLAEFPAAEVFESLLKLGLLRLR